MISISDILKLKVSYQVNTWSNISKESTIECILSQIKSDIHKTEIEILRNHLINGDKEYYDNYKKQLPSVTFSAVFNSKRTRENFEKYNPVIVLDIDKLDTIQIETTYNCLLSDDYVFAFWRSPSNNGYKGLVAIGYQFETAEIDVDILHKTAFKKLSEYFFNKYGIVLDRSGSDITRLCFLSYDDNLIQKVKLNSFEIFDDDVMSPKKPGTKKEGQLNFSSNRDALYNPLGKNSLFDRKIMTDIIRFLNNKKLSITFNYEEWCKVAMAIANTFTFEIGLNYFSQLSSLDINKYNEVACTNFLINCFETRRGEVTFSSIIYLANQKGYRTKYQKNGVPKVEG
jgi:hypothetical protein